ncbi:unnamed protein product [Ixodes persulcatus]
MYFRRSSRLPLVLLFLHLLVVVERTVIPQHKPRLLARQPMLWSAVIDTITTACLGWQCTEHVACHTHHTSLAIFITTPTGHETPIRRASTDHLCLINGPHSALIKASLSHW